MDLTFRNLAQRYGTTKANLRSRVKRIERDNPDIQVTDIKKNTTVLTDAGFRLLEEELAIKPFTKKKQKQPAGELTGADNSKQGTMTHSMDYTENNTLEAQITAQNTNALVDVLQSQLDANMKQIELLQSQLLAKDKQLEAKDKQIADLIETLNQSLTQSNELTNNLTNLTGHAQTIIDRDRQPLEMPQGTAVKPEPALNQDEVIEVEIERPQRTKKHKLLSKFIVASRVFFS